MQVFDTLPSMTDVVYYSNKCVSTRKQGIKRAILKAGVHKCKTKQTAAKCNFYQPEAKGQQQETKKAPMQRFYCELGISNTCSL